MNVLTLIHYAVVYIVGFVSFLFGRWLVLPSVKIFIPGLGNDALTQSYDAALTVNLTMLGIVLAVLVVLYIIYQILRRIFPFNFFIGKITPFKELRRSGIFGLFDSLIGAFFSRGSFATRVTRVLRGIGNFVRGNFEMVGETTREILTAAGVPDPNKRSPKPRYTDPPPPPENEPTEKSPFSEDEQKQTNEEFQQCLEENTVVVTQDMTDSDKKQADVQNTFVQVKCKVKAFQSAMNIFAFKV